MAKINDLRANDSDLRFSVEDTVYFSDISPTRTKINSEPSSNLSDAYPFHQGVEIRSFKSYAAGTAKILTGDPGNTIKQCVFGQDDDGINSLRNGNATFVDNAGFNPVSYVLGNYTPTQFVDSTNQSYISNGALNSVIEPLTIRDVAAFSSLYFPYEPHSIWASLEGANISQVRSSEIVVSVDEIKFDSNIPFYDSFETDTITGKPGNGYFLWEQTYILPFVDSTNNIIIKDQLNGPVTNIIDSLNYGDEGYVPNNQSAFTSGFIYDGATLGTDSIAFGGLKFT